MRPPPGAGVAHTGRRWRSASATAASQAPLMSTSGPTTSTGFFAASRRAASVAHRLGVGHGAAGHAARDGPGRLGVVGLDVPVVHRDRDERRAAGRQGGVVDGAGQRRRHVLGARGLVAPLDERVRHAGGVAVGEVRLHGHVGADLLAGGDEQRSLVGLGVEEGAHGVAHARGGVQVHVRDAARGLGVAVGHAHGHRLLEPQDVAEVRGVIGQHRQLGGARVAEHRRHAAGAEELEGGLADGAHGGESIRRRRVRGPRSRRWPRRSAATRPAACRGPCPARVRASRRGWRARWPSRRRARRACRRFRG